MSTETGVNIGIDAAINNAVGHFADIVESVVFFPVRYCDAGSVSFGYPEGFCADGVEIVAPLILIWLVLASIYFTVYLGFVNVRFFKHSIDLLRGKYDKKDTDGGQINRFQALATSLSGTVGLGNIAGVAIAVSVGGPGAVLWMIIMGFFGMSLKFAEVTFGVKYRHHPDKNDLSRVFGGPMYYLRDGFSNRDIPYIGSALAALFAFCCILGSIGGGNLFQANQAYQQILNVTGGEQSILANYAWLFGVGLAILVGAVIIGGIQSIAKFTSKIVPIMGGLYVGGGLIVIGLNYDQIASGLYDIVTMAFSFEAGLGGFLGVMLQGVKRASFSNEAGLGSAAIVHATAKTDQPVSQGFVGMLGPFIDTMVICTITGLVIVFTGAYKDGVGMEGVELTSKAFGAGVSWFPYLLAVTVFLFAFSTLITWSYYGQKAAAFLFGENKYVEMAYKIIFLLVIIVGCTMELGKVVALSEAFLFVMGIPNIIGLYFLSRELKRDVKTYKKHIDGVDADNASQAAE
tara:strand:- start:487043 stop:488590 length:1548 start_codon:yes stop_codon:yes gene_type:complete